MRIAVLGAGGVGGYFGGALARAGHEVALLARGNHLEALRERGLEVRTPAGTFTVAVEAAADPAALGAADLALVAVKTYSLPEITPAARRLAETGADVLPLLNGVDAADRLVAGGVPADRVLGGLTEISAARIAPGIVERRSAFQRVVVGERAGGISERTERIAAAFCEAGADARASADITADLWRKFAFISTVSAACGLARSPVGPIRDAPLGHLLIERALREVFAVGRALGVALSSDDEMRILAFIDSLPAAIKPSFLLDLESGGPTEIDDLSGAVARLSRRAGVETPVHDVAAAALGIARPLTIGGAPVVILERPRPADAGKPAFSSASVLPARGMMTLQIKAHLPSRGETDLLAPSLEQARALLDANPGEFKGNNSYYVGGAILLPYANRIPGRLSPDRKTIETEILGRTVRLPANAGGKRPGAERYAMHGLILESGMDEVRRETAGEEDRLRASFAAGDFGGHWRSQAEISFEYVLRSDSLTLAVTAQNAGNERLPVGIGWHPYFALPSGRREQARLRIPARRRAVVNDYDEVLPTGEIVPVAGTPYDFSPPGGKALGDLYLDDCFVDLERTAAGHVVAEIVDPDAAYGLRLVATSPAVKALQVYAPLDAPFIALEPQLNWADPFGAQWGPDVDTGMAILEPGQAVVYSVRLELFTP